ncbi:MAG: glucose-6-phosphate dehydrogenase assembly protein OpcA [Acidobacteriia bacterium]|nr:glucose-6-phosphate dehydrogenase assembly protein OpcA [Terriglobia bacterium]
MAEQPPTVMLAEPRAASVANLEGELSALWRSASEEPSTRDALTRSCALTLLVYVESEAEGREVNDLIGAVTAQNPCRVIILIGEPLGSPPGLSATVSAHCHLPEPGAKQVCCEQITLHARGTSVENIDNVTLPLIVSGLPVHLWWRAGRFAPPAHFDQILRVADHVMLDSARFPNPEADLRMLAARLETGVETLKITDLNWARITPWRELVAQCFDHPARRPFLDRLTDVRMAYEAESPRVLTQRSQAMLLTGWLASRLKWEFAERRVEGSAEFFVFRDGEREIRIEREARQFDGAGCGVCFTLDLRADGAAPATFTFSRGPDGAVVQTRAEVPGSGPVGRTVRLEVMDEVAILNEELKVVGRDHVYEEAVRMAARMVASA